jgi:hypothetical protein
MIVVFWLFLPFFIGGTLVLVVDFLGETVMGFLNVGGVDP